MIKRNCPHPASSIIFLTEIGISSSLYEDNALSTFSSVPDGRLRYPFLGIVVNINISLKFLRDNIRYSAVDQVIQKCP